ncbi:DNAJ protein Xdj1 [Schizosaccharomyces cryophilus OY26]|uniref:DNAJ protein Xdj1 n=1 Tax=Schizosaccharomyces cryophilus (strain OY26 / ATCC MYA-4695 / CBS 11777 / NBRC 106824 / NRRL Y48691) TaxID=653667 RepID=S9W625_SCHCR|nr:DNAJ protein Xdj1 [Schizosaccharomyces cryophilus OY26]EPY54014.1 DNAJ protein Xdj1 [Schizosaccharomyces cryophilus OY26]
MVADTTLYDILEVDSTASADEIKKRYKKLALQNHPDKVAESDREDAAARFRNIQTAYDVLREPSSRETYDMYGLEHEGHDNSQNGVDINDVLAQMFGMNFGAHGAPGQQKRRGSDVVHDYEITLEDMFKGKEIKLRATRNVICPHCQGKGGKRFAKERSCLSCSGKGVQQHLHRVGPHHVTTQQSTCEDCNGRGSNFRTKDRCKYCKGSGVVGEKRVLTFYVRRSAKEMDKVVQPGMADEALGMTPGDVVLRLRQVPHPVYERVGDDLKAKLKISLAEALVGFKRAVVTTLDGRILEYYQPKGKILRPGDCIVIPGEGMYRDYQTDLRGDLYLEVEIEFPKDDSLDGKSMQMLQNILPACSKQVPVTKDAIVDSVTGQLGDVSNFGGSARFENPFAEEEEFHSVPECTAQ